MQQDSPAYSFSLKPELRDRFLVTRVDICSPALPLAFDNFTFAQLTDFHLGAATPLRDIEGAIPILKDLNPDLLLLTGDYIQVTRHGWHHLYASAISPKHINWIGHRRRAREQVALLRDFLSELNPAEGIWGVFGNHDHYEGIGSLKRLLSGKVQWLQNDSALLHRGGDSLSLIGIDDWKAGTPDLQQAKRKVKDSLSFFSILLSHNPDVAMLERKELLSDISLILSGHTHGGQICLPGGIPLVTRTNQRLHVKGLSKNDSMHFYVNNGLGCQWVRRRVFCPREITLFRFLKS